MHALRIRGAQRLARAARIPPRRYASALPGYPTPGSAFSPPPAPVSTPESSSANVNVPGQRSAGRHNISGTAMSQKADTNALPESDIPIFTTLADLRAWRDTAFREGKTVGFVPTMGALHQGHITLVRESLKENDLTVISIYVNPSQFAPHEDLATYPRTLASDVSLLSACSHTPSSSNPSSPTPPTRTPSAIFCPTTSELYPSGHSHSAQLGTYVLPAPSLASQMEGKSRPTFFRGVATVVTKLLNSVLPTRVYFGQKDIQQALLMKGVVRDLCAPAKVRVIRTVREEGESMEGGARLALSSRNAYLSRAERRVAPTLRRALGAVEAAWYAGANRSDALAAGQAVVDQVVRQFEGEGKEGEKVEMKLDYMEMNDPRTFEVIPESLRTEVKDGPGKGPAVILSGALWVGRTRLIDNILLGDAGWVFE